MIRDYGYRTASFSRTFDCYDYVDCFNYMNIHDQLKLYKHGFSKVTDHACREIRHGRLTREEGASLVCRFEQRPIEFCDLFCEWLGVTRRSLQFLMDRHRNPLFWHEASPGLWRFVSDAAVTTRIESDIAFESNDKFDTHDKVRYIVVGKGFP